MTDITLMTAAKDPATVLPALAVLSHRVRVLQPVPASIQKMPSYTILLLDARTDLARSKALCRMIHAANLPIPSILILTEGGFTAVNSEWGVSELVLSTASPAEVEARIRLMNERSLRTMLEAPGLMRARARAGAITSTPSATADARRLEASALSQLPTGAGTGPARSEEEQEQAASPIFESGDLKIDEQGYSASVRGKGIKLAYKEFELLNFLARHPGRAFTRNQLLQSVWGYDYYGGTRTVDVHVRRLRVKLGSDSGMISTVRNVGYRYDPFINGERATGKALEKARAEAARLRSTMPEAGRQRATVA